MSTPSNQTPTRVQGSWLLRLLSSFGLACLILFFMTVATLLGTLAQKEMGLYNAQREYFESWFYLQKFLLGSGVPITVPLPGGMLLMGLLGVNLLVGGLIRLRRKPQNIGLFITHSSILVILAAGLVEHLFKIDGNLMVKEGQTANTFQSFHDRVIELLPLGGEKREAFVIPAEKFRDRPNAEFLFLKEPVRLVVRKYILNSLPAQAGADSADAVDGFDLKSRPELETDDEANLEGAVVDLVSDKGKASALLWAGVDDWAVVTLDGKDYALRIGRRKYRLPFAITLNDFIREVYPGTDKPKRFSSLVSVAHANGKKEDVDITMNQPLRSEGYAVFQSSFANSGQREASVFQIARNPSDSWPLVGFSMVFAGLLIHFLLKLFRFIGGASRDKS